MTEEEYEKAIDYIELHFDDEPKPDDFMDLVIKVEAYEEEHFGL